MDERILRTLFGLTEIPGNLVVTPSDRIYDEFADRMQDYRDFHGWYRCRVGRVNDRDTALIKTQMGSSIIDPVVALSTENRRMIFLGYCGSLDDITKIGDIVTTNETSFESGDEKYVSKCKNTTRFPSRRNITVSSMLLEDLEALKSFETVDMETFFVYKFFRGPSISMMVTTDIPGRINFYDVGENERRKIEEAVPILVSESVGAING